MSADKSHLLGLIGLRALAERDPVEYSRVADLSKRDLDHRINVLRKEVSDPECDALYQQMVELTQSAENLQEADMLLQQVYLTSVLKSQYESLLAAKERSSSKSSLPSEIIETKIEASGQRWRSEKQRREMHTNLVALNDMIAGKKSPDLLFECLGDILNRLGRKETVTGSAALKKSMIWESCKDILATTGGQLVANLSADSLWDAVREGAAAEWLRVNARFVDAPTAQESQARQESRK